MPHAPQGPTCTYQMRWPNPATHSPDRPSNTQTAPRMIWPPPTWTPRRERSTLLSPLVMKMPARSTSIIPFLLQRGCTRTVHAAITRQLVFARAGEPQGVVCLGAAVADVSIVVCHWACLIPYALVYTSTVAAPSMVATVVATLSYTQTTRAGMSKFSQHWELHLQRSTAWSTAWSAEKGRCRVPLAALRHCSKIPPSTPLQHGRTTPWHPPAVTAHSGVTQTSARGGPTAHPHLVALCQQLADAPPGPAEGAKKGNLTLDMKELQPAVLRQNYRPRPVVVAAPTTCTCVMLTPVTPGT